MATLLSCLYSCSSLKTLLTFKILKEFVQQSQRYSQLSKFSKCSVNLMISQMHIKEVQKSLGSYTLDAWSNAVTVRRNTWKLTPYCFNDTFHTDGYNFNNTSLFYICAALLCKCSVLFPNPLREIPTTMKRIHYDNAFTSRVVHRTWFGLRVVIVWLMQILKIRLLTD